jgi:hypothetical protein
MKKIIFWLLCASLVITALCLLVYGTVQQNIRQSANDPQIQIAEDASYDLAHGEVPADIVPHGTIPVEMSRSLAPFIMIIDSNGSALESSVTLSGQMPAVPAGVLAYVLAHGEDRITWQPQEGVRVAAVVTSFTLPNGTSGFVLAGRSLREVEIREAHIGNIVLAAWAVLMIGLIAFGVVAKYLV